MVLLLFQTSVLYCLLPVFYCTKYLLFSDAGYLSTDVYKVLLATVWIPFLDTNRKNGCMEVIGIRHMLQYYTCA